MSAEGNENSGGDWLWVKGVELWTYSMMDLYT